MIDESVKPEHKQIDLVVTGEKIDARVPLKMWADVYGSMAVHRSIGGAWWSVTHVRTGGYLASHKQRGPAEHLARMLGDVVPDEGEWGVNAAHLVNEEARVILRSWTIENDEPEPPPRKGGR